MFVKPARSQVRTLLRQLFPLSDDLDSFLIDHFPEVKAQCFPAMTRDQRVNLLFERHSLEEILDAAAKYDDPKGLVSQVRAKLSLRDLQAQPSPIPTAGATRPSRSHRRDFSVLLLGALVWEKLRSVATSVWNQSFARVNGTWAAIVAGVGAVLIAIGLRLINSGQPPSSPVIPAATPDLSVGPTPVPTPPSVTSVEVPDLATKRPSTDRPDFGTSPKPPIATSPKLSANPDLSQASAIHDLSVETEAVPDLATVAHPDLRPMPVLVCPDSLNIQVAPGSDTMIEQDSAKKELLAEMHRAASMDGRVSVRPRCEKAASSGADTPITFTARMDIQNVVTKTQKMCPPGSSRNCYDLVSRTITCEFLFAVNGFTSQYTCPTGKYFRPSRFEVNYHEPSNEREPWTPVRRGKYAIEKCSNLVGSVVQLAVCKRR
jgi:hypothetical protein